MPAKFAIQGELGSNSHMAAAEMLAGEQIVPCATSAQVVEQVLAGEVDGAVLPIENSLHGSVAEHYDLLLRHPLRIVRESLLRVRHNIIAAPGVRLAEIRRLLSHPVALGQCRRWLAEHPHVEAVQFYDTAGAVRQVCAEPSSDAAGIAPELAAEVYGGHVLVRGIEDHTENFTRFHLLLPEDQIAGWAPQPPPNKVSLAFAIEHRPGSLVEALQVLASAGVNLSKIESRPVPGRPWEYIFYVDLRFETADEDQVTGAVDRLRSVAGMVKELGRYRSAG